MVACTRMEAEELDKKVDKILLEGEINILYFNDGFIMRNIHDDNWVSDLQRGMNDDIIN